MANLSENVNELLNDIAFENARPEERWFSRNWFDPPHGKSALSNAAQRGLIELDKTEIDNWRFRFTAKGRDFHEKVHSKEFV